MPQPYSTVSADGSGLQGQQLGHKNSLHLSDTLQVVNVCTQRAYLQASMQTIVNTLKHSEGHLNAV